MLKVATTQYKSLTRWDVKSYLHNLTSSYPIVTLAPYLIENTTRVKPFDFPNQEFDILGVRNKEGIYFNETLLGSKINQPYHQVNGGDIFYNPYRVNVGSIGIVPQAYHHKYTSPAYVVFSVNQTHLLAEYLLFIMKAGWFNNILRGSTSGSVRQNLTFALLRELKIPLPPIEEQKEIITIWQSAQIKSQTHLEQAEQIKKDIDTYLLSELGITIHKQEKSKVFTTRFKDLERWSLQYIMTKHNYVSMYSLISLGNSQYASLIQRGSSPKYADSDKYILNQQCNRWNDINLSFVKTVDTSWLSSINKEKFTQVNDIIINSTGEGTIGRASVITEKAQGLMYDSHILLVRLIDINATFFVELFNSDFGQNQVNTIKSAQSTKQTELGIENLKKIQIPLPPLGKQEELVKHISILREEILQHQKQASNIIASTKELIKNRIIN